MANSHRFLSSKAADGDAYLLTDSRWFLFLYLKDPTLASDLSYFPKIAAGFSAGPVAVVVGALKTEKESRALEPFLPAGMALEEEYWCREAWLRFRLEAKEVLNPGLFLDQSGNRVRLGELIQEAVAQGALDSSDSLINLFSYTGSFTMAALGAGARDATSVDVSARYLGWERRNFEGNFGGLEVEHRLIKDDARDYVRRLAKRGARYRWIIVDPPTFSRGQGERWKAQDDLPALVNELLGCLNRDKKSAILVSVNDSRWADKDFYSVFEKFARANRLVFERGHHRADFGSSHPLKSAWLISNG